MADGCDLRTYDLVAAVAALLVSLLAGCRAGSCNSCIRYILIVMAEGRDLSTYDFVAAVAALLVSLASLSFSPEEDQ